MRAVANPILMGALFLVLAGGCDAPVLDALPPTLEQVQSIRDDNDLSSQQKRTALEQLGLTPLVINGVLGSVRTGNQYGGDLRSAYDKVTGDQLNELTPDEVQIYGDAASDAEADLDVVLNDAEAQAIVDVFRDNEIASKDDLLDLLEDPVKAAMIPGDVPDGALNDLFVDFDPAALLESLP